MKFRATPGVVLGLALIIQLSVGHWLLGSLETGVGRSTNPAGLGTCAPRTAVVLLVLLGIITSVG